MLYIDYIIMYCTGPCPLPCIHNHPTPPVNRCRGGTAETFLKVSCTEVEPQGGESGAFTRTTVSRGRFTLLFTGAFQYGRRDTITTHTAPSPAADKTSSTG